MSYPDQSASWIKLQLAQEKIQSLEAELKTNYLIKTECQKALMASQEREKELKKEAQDYIDGMNEANKIQGRLGLGLHERIEQLEADKRELVWLLKEIHEDGDLLPMAYGLEGGEQIRDAAERLIKKHTQKNKEQPACEDGEEKK